MGWCHEFGVEIEPRCNHPMGAGASSCSCSQCGAVCRGRFEGGCEAVWARGPRPNAPVRSINTVSVARVRPSGKGLAQFDGAHPVNGAGRVEVDAVSRVGAEAAGGAGQPHLALAMAALAEQVAQQAKRQATMERHLADLGKVLGQLGLEVDERLGMVEHILDKLTAPNEQQRP